MREQTPEEALSGHENSDIIQNWAMTNNSNAPNVALGDDIEDGEQKNEKSAKSSRRGQVGTENSIRAETDHIPGSTSPRCLHAPHVKL